MTASQITENNAASKITKDYLRTANDALLFEPSQGFSGPRSANQLTEIRGLEVECINGKE